MIEIIHDACGQIYLETEWKGIDEHLRIQCPQGYIPRCLLYRVIRRYKKKV